MTYSAEQCDQKWRNLKGSYRRFQEKGGLERGIKPPKFYDDLAELFATSQTNSLADSLQGEDEVMVSSDDELPQVIVSVYCIGCIEKY